ncbi:PHB depolymerase family esterase [Demequina sp. NBRC 110056]|uniref:alpha/beta hydrolase family esterase n=1 Tax=Demequina sp. NBRC 110056 TaxID=1570345 RepID=UPI0013564629|nr:PHB depolymerase family esterase [Demequina sp. NBRC 110056]
MTADATTATPEAAPRPRRRLRRALIWTASILGGLVLVLAGLFLYFVWVPAPEEPDLDADVVHASLTVDGLERTYTAVVPEGVEPGAPLWVALHGSNMDGDGMRGATGFQLDELAVEHGFVVLYPDGYEKSWHGCRTETPYPARIDGIDDVAFLEALIGEAASEYGSDPARVYGVGYSNGSHMLFRMAAESPGTFAGIQANAANYPAADNYGCEPLTEPVPTILVEGTSDPINPYEGGQAGAFGQNLGEVLSAQDSALAIAAVNGVEDEATEEVVGGTAGEADAVTATVYGAASDAPVALFTVEGGGHTVPNPVTQTPRIMGGGTEHLNAPVVAWELFSALEGGE